MMVDARQMITVWWTVNTPVKVIIVIGWWKSLANLWHYPLLHGPLLRAEDPDIVVVCLSLEVPDDLDEWSERFTTAWDRGCHFWWPMTVLLAHSLLSPQDIPEDHHGAGSLKSHWPYRWRRPPGLMGEGVPLSARLCGDRNGRMVRFEKWYMEGRVNLVLWGKLKLICDWIDLSDDGEGAKESGTELLAGQVHPDVPGGQPDLLTRLFWRSFCPAKVCCRLRTARCSWWWAASQNLLLSQNEESTDGTSDGSPDQVAGSRVCTGREWVQWMVGEASSVRTQPSLVTGSKSSGDHGRRFAGNVQLPESSSPSARWTEDGIQKRGLWSRLGARKRPSIFWR